MRRTQLRHNMDTARHRDVVAVRRSYSPSEIDGLSRSLRVDQEQHTTLTNPDYAQFVVQIVENYLHKNRIPVFELSGVQSSNNEHLEPPIDVAYRTLERFMNYGEARTSSLQRLRTPDARTVRIVDAYLQVSRRFREESGLDDLVASEESDARSYAVMVLLMLRDRLRPGERLDRLIYEASPERGMVVSKSDLAGWFRQEGEISDEQWPSIQTFLSSDWLRNKVTQHASEDDWKERALGFGLTLAQSLDRASPSIRAVSVMRAFDGYWLTRLGVAIRCVYEEGYPFCVVHFKSPSGAGKSFVDGLSSGYLFVNRGATAYEIRARNRVTNVWQTSVYDPEVGYLRRGGFETLIELSGSPHVSPNEDELDFSGDLPFAGHSRLTSHLDIATGQNSKDASLQISAYRFLKDFIDRILWRVVDEK